MTSNQPGLGEPLKLPCGATLPNRLAKAAMTEGLADPWLRATERHQRLYRLWSEGGAGLLLTGNVMIDRRVLERPGNVAIDGNGGLSMLESWARAGTSAGNQLWMQISHAGRQSPRYVTRQPLAPSDVQLKLAGNYARPRAVSEDEIQDFIGRFGRVAGIAKQTGFTGVQVHGAHGYLLSSFLSPVTNRRTDRWGGSLENRARFLLEAVRRVRSTVGPDFPVAVKLNSADFQKGGFDENDCLQVVEWLNDEGIDLLEISGGNYEQPRLLGYSGREETAAEGAETRQSTREREAYFLDFAAKVRAVRKMPLMVTGGFRSRTVMEDALASGDADVIGLGRPLCTDPDVPLRLLSRELDTAPRYESSIRLGTGVWGGNSSVFLLKLVNVLGQQGWYYQQIMRLADGKSADPRMPILIALGRYLTDEWSTAARMKR
ncbi:NADH:flavin oxidoreductase/NADH oxidase family protein [uncultured Abyssibacter sp.]|uniref:NADH:flavin oxidoreductase/NADH oxidase family protein n=1 Tax=uncultured Abyssibacter sp. TaxID=2320202 RepID=UPI0032B2E03F